MMKWIAWLLAALFGFSMWGLGGCDGKYGGEVQIGVGQSATNEVYVYHRTVRDEEDTGTATVQWRFQALIDYLVQLKDAELLGTDATLPTAESRNAQPVSGDKETPLKDPD